MAIFGALFSSVSALNAQGSSLATISDNISNFSTNGYKVTTTQFSSFVIDQFNRRNYLAGGVRANSVQLIDRQGLLQSSDSETDLGIAGQGFFVVRDTSDVDDTSLRYTRAGSFTADELGNLQNTAGFYLLGWPTNAQGELAIDVAGVAAELTTVNLNNLVSTSVPTSQISIAANLPAGALRGDFHTVNATVYDGFGLAHSMPLVFTKQPDLIDASGQILQNIWSVEGRAPEGSSVIDLKDAEGNIFSSSGRLDFTTVPRDGDTVTLGALVFEFDQGDGVAAGNIAVNFTDTDTNRDVAAALAEAYQTVLGGFRGTVAVQQASELNTQGGGFTAVPVVTTPPTPPGLSEAAFNVLSAAFDEGVDVPDGRLSFDLITRGNAVQLVGKTNLAFRIGGGVFGSFGRDSDDLSAVAAGTPIEVYVRDDTIPGGRALVTRIEVPPGGINAGENGKTTDNAIEISGFEYMRGSYPNLDFESIKPVGSFDSATSATLSVAGVSAAANAALRNPATLNFDDATNTLSLNLQSAAGGTQIRIAGAPNLAFSVNGGGRNGFGVASPDLAALVDGNTIEIFVNDGGAGAQIAVIEVGGALLPDPADALTADALEIGGFTYSAATQGFNGPVTVTNNGGYGGSFASAPTIERNLVDLPQSVQTALNQSGALQGGDTLSLNLETAGGEVRLQGVPYLSFRVTNGGVTTGARNNFGAASPDLAGLPANAVIEIYIDDNGSGNGGTPRLISQVTLDSPLRVGEDGTVSEDALRISGFDDYQLGSVIQTGGAPFVAGVTPNPGGDFGPLTMATLPQTEVSPKVQALLNTAGSDSFNRETGALTLGLETIADPPGSANKLTHIRAIPNLAFVFNPGGGTNVGPALGNAPGAFGQPSIDLTQGVNAGDTIDIYADTEGSPTLIARVTLDGPVSDVDTQIGETTPNALRISGFDYETDERLSLGEEAQGNTLFFSQALGQNSINIDPSRTDAIQQTLPFIIRSIIRPDPPNVVFNGLGAPQSLNIETAEIQWANGADNSDIALNLGTPGQSEGGLSYLSEPFTIRFIRQDGVPSGTISGVSVSEDGLVVASFDNELNRPIFQLPLAIFQNPNALSQKTGNIFVPSPDSGEPLFTIPGAGATGAISQKTLEQSTVDIANEFSKMIITQRAFSAASRVVTTADEMLDELVRIKR